MTDAPGNPWHTDRVDPTVVERLATVHVPDRRAVDRGVDIISDPHRQDDGGHNWTRLRCARDVADVVPGAAVIVGSAVGEYLAKVLAWDFEISDDDPIVVLELLPIQPSEVRRLLNRHTPAA